MKVRKIKMPKYPSTQCPAVRTWNSEISTPPQYWPAL